MASDPTRNASRRQFLAAGAWGSLAAGAFGADEPKGSDRPLEVPTMKAATEAKSDPPFSPLPPEKRLGFAIVGLGELALGEVLPAFGHSKFARPTALVSGNRSKAEEVAQRYGIGSDHIYDYKNFDRIANDTSVDVIYIILPNGLHPEFTIRSAKAGKHVLCEKPMANSSADCEEMIAACAKADRKLMIAYRCQYEPHHREAIRRVRSGEMGPLRMIEASNGQNQGPVDQWRHKKSLAGGGSLPDVGIYCLNAARYLTGEEPHRVSARIVTDTSDPRFKEVEDRVSFDLEFPSGVLASCRSFYSAHESRTLRILSEKGWLSLDPAYSYSGLRMKTSQAQGKSDLTTEIRLPEKNQFATEIDHMARCVMSGKEPHTPGQEGMQDLRIIEAIYKASREGHPVELPTVIKRDSTRGPAPD